MNKILNKFFLGLVGLSFILGIIFSLNYKVDAADERAFTTRTTIYGNSITSTSEVPANPKPTVNVWADGQTSKTINYGDKVTISWASTGATSCDSGGYGTGTTGSYETDYLTATTTFNVTCSEPAYCYGAYKKKVDWNGNDFDWVGGTIYNGDGGGCGYCSQRGNLGYQVKSDSTNGYSWYQPTCVETGFLGCSGSRWSDNAARIDSAYVSTSCGDFTNSYTCLSAGVNPETNSYWNSQIGLIKSCTWNPYNASASNGSSSVTVTVPAPINGSCWGTHYACSTGTSANNVSNPTNWTWNCIGQNGGTNVSCSQIIAGINGSCSGTHYNCNTGTSVNNTEGYQKWLWGCNGSGGGTYASCSQIIPPPTNLTSSCPSPGTLASLSWTLPSGYTLSYLRIQDNMTSYVTFIPEGGVDSGPSFSFTTIPGHEYLSWVHTRLPSGASSSEIYSSFNCIPAPSGNLTASPSFCSITAGNSSCNVPLTWTTTNPIGTSAITSNYPYANTILADGNSGTNQPVAVPYLSSPRIFYLYNNAILLAQASAASGCAINTTWNGSICAIDTNLVSTSVNTGGTISPTSKIVNYGATTTFTVTPNSGYTASASGCGGSLSGTTYTTGAITAACTVTATFSLILLVPTVTTTTPVTSITQTTATGGGNTISDGGSPVTQAGLVWHVSANPTTSLYTGITFNGWAIGGPWTSGMTGLTTNTTYHVRAYATNSVGTSYGADVSFTTIGVTSGTLTASGCTIPENGNNCLSTLTWNNTTNPVGVSTIKTPNAAGSVVVTPATVAGTTTSTVPYPSRTFVLVNNGATLDTKTAIASCNISINHWDGTKCALNAPTTTFTVNNATSATIFKGRSATLRWDSTGASCTSTGLGFDVSTHLPTSTSGSSVVSPLITTTYTLACTNVSGTDNNTVTTKVIILNIKEQ